MATSRIGLLVQRLSARPRTRDAVVAVLYLLLGLALLQFGGYSVWPASWQVTAGGPLGAGTGFLLLLVVMAALATARSTRPYTVLAASVPLAATDLLLGGSLGVLFLFADFVYCAFRYGADGGIRVLLMSIVAVCVGVVIMFLVWPVVAARFATVALQWILVILIAALWGWNVRSERMRTRAIMSEEHLRSTQRLRQRIAHDLHDLVANQIAVAGLNIEAARLAMRNRTPHEIDDSLIRATRGTDEAHRELRRLITVLTTVDDIEHPSEPPVRDLDDLIPVGRALVHRGAGLDEALAGLTPQSAGIATRVIQELVTNAVKHGAGDIELAVAGDGPMTVQVFNRRSGGARSVASSGIGISGAAMLLSGIGGSMHSGATDDGGWSATITMPEEHYA